MATLIVMLRQKLLGEIVERINVSWCSNFYLSRSLLLSGTFGKLGDLVILWINLGVGIQLGVEAQESLVR